MSINKVETSTRAIVESGATVDLNNGSLNLTALGSTRSVAEAKPLQNGATGASLGFGASVAWSIVDNVTEAAIETGGTVTNGNAVKLAATGHHDIQTRALMSASGGNAARGGRMPSLLKQSPLERLERRNVAYTKIHAGSLWCHWLLVNGYGNE